MHTLMTLAGSTDPADLAANPTYWGGGLIWYVIEAFFLMKVFQKADLPAWYAWVPFVNLWGIVRLAGRGVGTFILLFVPLVNIVAWIIVALRMGRAFGKEGVFSFFLLAWFHIIGVVVIALDDSRYAPRGLTPAEDPRFR
ncbi:MAG: hypothetical protein J0H73_02325 [Salana multivorans]|uniref:DUF5684 domain-containing protein n=1 Tax=Salana multivorans TaxID=120377 RepID=UPI001AC59460|nr:DUF5684 domain-containing protein [Salana multivorans]MBN8881134.1 hypothetical protein [Salana multivorans]